MLTALSTRGGGGGGGGGGGRYMLYKPHSSDVPNSHNFNNGNFAAKGRRPLTKELAFSFRLHVE